MCHHKPRVFLKTDVKYEVNMKEKYFLSERRSFPIVTSCLLLGALLLPTGTALAQSPIDGIQPGQLAAASGIMDNCALIAKKISAITVPPGHDEAARNQHHNEELAKAHDEHHENLEKSQGMKSKKNAMDTKHTKPVDPVAAEFQKSMRAARRELQACGEKYQEAKKGTTAVTASMSQAMQKLPADYIKKLPPNSPEAQKMNKLMSEMAAYSKSGQDLQVAISSIGKDHQRYVSRVINKYFLDRE